MATLNIPDELYAKLEQLAATENRSIGDQTVRLLEKALRSEAQHPGEQPSRSVTEILAEIHRRREARPMDLGVPDSTALIREDRDL